MSSVCTDIRLVSTTLLTCGFFPWWDFHLWLLSRPSKIPSCAGDRIHAKHILLSVSYTFIPQKPPNTADHGDFPSSDGLGLCFPSHGCAPRPCGGEGASRKFSLLLLRGLATTVPNREKESSNQLAQPSQWSDSEAQRGNKTHSCLSRKNPSIRIPGPLPLLCIPLCWGFS